MIKFIQKKFTGNLVGEEYQTSKQKRNNKIVQGSLDEVTEHKEEMDKKKSNPAILKPTQKSGFSDYRTKKIKNREKSLNSLISEEKELGTISRQSLLNHGLRYGKKN